MALCVFCFKGRGRPRLDPDLRIKNYKRRVNSLSASVRRLRIRNKALEKEMVELRAQVKLQQRNDKRQSIFD